MKETIKVAVVTEDDSVMPIITDRGECTQPQIIIVGNPNSGIGELAALELLKAKLPIAAHIQPSFGVMSAEEYAEIVAKQSLKVRETFKITNDHCFPLNDFTYRGVDKPDNSKFYDRFYNKRRF